MSHASLRQRASRKSAIFSVDDLLEEGDFILPPEYAEKVLHPRNRFVRIWEWFVIVCILMQWITQTFLVSFDSTYKFLWAICFFCDAVNVVDILVTFFTAYVDEKGILITSRKRIVKRYLKSNFTVDLLSVLPTDLIQFGLKGASPMKTVTKLRMNRLLRMYKVIYFFNKREAELGSNIAFYRALKYAVISIVTTHSITCAWFAMACNGIHQDSQDGTMYCHLGSWANHGVNGSGFNITADSTGAAYITSLYWAVATVTSTGYGDISAVTLEEEWFSIFAMLAGIGVFFGMLLGGLTSMLTNFDQQRAHYVHRFNTIVEELKDVESDEDLKELVIGYYEYLWVRKKGMASQGLYSDLPITFQAEISHTAHKSMISKAHLFDDLGPGFMRMLSLNFQPRLYLPQQIIMAKGDIANVMCFIHKGEIEVLSENDEDSVIASLKTGKLFGEINLVYSYPRTATIRAGTHCDIITLQKSDLQKVLQFYPEVQKHLQDKAKARCETSTDTNTTTTTSNRRESVQVNANQFEAAQARKTSYLEPPTKVTARRKSFAPNAMPNLNMRKGSLEGGRSSLSFRPSIATNLSGALFGGDNAVSNIMGNLHYHPQHKSRHSIKISDSVQLYGDNDEGGTRVGDGVCMAFRQRIVDMKEWIMSVTIPPNSALHKLWNSCILCVIVIIGFIYPYMASFTALDYRRGYDSTVGSIMCVCTYILDFLMFLDIFIHLRTEIATPHGNKVEFQDIVSYYCKSRIFALDVASVIPLELGCFVADNPADKWRYFCFLRLNRCLKILKVPGFFDSLETGLDVSIFTLRCLKFLLYILMVTHWVACVLFVMTCTGDSCAPDSWITLREEEEGLNAKEISPLTEYIMSLYWATATMTSTGYGDIVAHSSWSQVAALSAMLVGLLLYGYVLAAMAATLANLDAIRVGFQERLFAVENFMKVRHLGSDLQDRMVKYLTLMWEKHHGEWMPGQKPLLHDIPLTLQQDIAIENNCWLLMQNPLFRDLEESFLRLLSTRLVPFLFIPDEVIVHKGDLGQEMYMIRRGFCQIIDPDSEVVLADIGPGQYFGEIAMLFNDYQLATVRAKTHCEVYELKMGDIQDCLQEFPIVRDQLNSVMHNKEIYRQMKEKCGAQMGKLIFKANAKMKKNSSLSGSSVNFSEHSLRARKPRGRRMSVRFTDEGGDEEETPKEDYWEPFRELSGLGRTASKLLLQRTFIPGGLFLVWWGRLQVLIGMTLSLTIPLQAALLLDSVPLWSIHYLLDVISFANIYICFHVAYHNEEGILILHPVYTARNYLTSNFWIDLVGCFPYEIFACVFLPSFDFNILHVFAFMRINRMILVHRLPYAFSSIESNIAKPTGNIRTVKYIVYTLIFMNFLTCTLFMLACPPSFDYSDSDVENITFVHGLACRNGSWLYKLDFDLETADVFSLYIVSFYWASATSVSVGYGDIAAHSDAEMALAAFFMISGVLMFGYIIASVAATLANADTQRAIFQKKLDAIKRYMKDHEVHEPLQQRVISHYDYVWLKTHGIDPVTLFDGVPLSLWGEVTFCMYKDIISKIPWFKDTERSFIKMLSKAIKPMFFLKGEYIVRKYDVGSEVYFIHRGMVEVVTEDEKTVIHRMTAPANFGEDAWLFSSPRTATVRAGTNVDIFTLTKEDLDYVLECYPAIKKKITKLTEDERIHANRRKKLATQKATYAKHVEIKAIDTIAGPSGKNKKLRKRNRVSYMMHANDGDYVFSAEYYKRVKEDEMIMKPETPAPSYTRLTHHETLAELSEEDEEDISNNNNINNSAREGLEMREMNSDRTGEITPVEVVVNVQNIDTGAQNVENYILSGTNGSPEKKTPEPESVKQEPEIYHRRSIDEEIEALGVGMKSKRDSRASEHPDRREDLEVDVKTGVLGRWRRLTFKPTNLFIRRLLDFTCILSVISTWIVVYQSLFQDHSVINVYLLHFCILFYYIEIIIKSRLQYYDHNSDLISSPKDISRHYFCQWNGFILDLVAAFPTDILCMAFPVAHRDIGRSWFRVVNLARLVRVKDYFSKWEKELNVNMLLVRLCKFFVIFTLLVHFFSGLWYLIACPMDMCRDGSWAQKLGFHNKMDAYGKCVYWCIATMTSTGYGDIRAYSLLEMVFASVVMISGKLIFGIILANIASTLSNEESQKVKYDQKLRAIQVEMEEQDLPKMLQHRVVEYFNYVWTRNKGCDINTLFKDAPFCLRADICTTVTKDMLDHIPLFQVEGMNESFHRLLSERIKAILFMPGDYIVRQGDMGREMYYILHGQVEVVTDDDPPEVTAILHPGDIFGEICLVCRTPRRVTVRAANHVDVFSLSKQDLDAVLKFYPHLKEDISKKALEIYGRTN